MFCDRFKGKIQYFIAALHTVIHHFNRGDRDAAGGSLLCQILQHLFYLWPNQHHLIISKALVKLAGAVSRDIDIQPAFIRFLQHWLGGITTIALDLAIGQKINTRPQIPFRSLFHNIFDGIRYYDI